MDPVAFLRGRPPFDRLAAGPMRRVEEALAITWAPAGERVLRRGGERSRFLYVVRKGAVRLERDGAAVQVLEEGELFGFPSLIGRTAPSADAVAVEDTLLYTLPDAVFDRLMENREFAEFFLEDLAERLRRSAAVQPLPIGGELATPVGELPVSPPVWVAATATVGEAARAMRDARVSAVLVAGASATEPPGILTDRDLRTRVLAADRGPATPVAEVASRPLHTLPTTATLFEALVFLLEQHVHHAPLARQAVGGAAPDVVGVLTDSDLLRLQGKSPLLLLRSIERLESRDELPRYAVELAAMVESLVWGGLDAVQVAPIVSRLDDALARRLLVLAERELGPPPCPYAWIVFGSEGRMEQTILTDQDNALVYEADGEAAAGYFERLAWHVVEGLVAAGFPPCRGGFMATRWNRPLAAWETLFRGWIERPEPQALLEALNFFDFRAVHGTLDLAALDAVVARARREPLFLAQLARASLGLRPPIGAFRQLKVDGGVDLKRGGIVPIVGLARLYALEAGSRARPTLARLAHAAESATLSREGAATLAAGYRFLASLRLREQLRALRAGEPVSHVVDVDRLSPLERQHLKDVFLAVRELQQATALRHGIARLA